MSKELDRQFKDLKFIPYIEKRVSKEILTLRKEIIEEFTPLWDMNDPAHNIHHFNEVFITALIIKDKLGLKELDIWILYVAYFHDLFAFSRKNHEKLARDFILSSDHRLVTAISDNERLIIAKACEEHRANYTGPFYSKLSELMSSADRGRPLGADKLVARSIRFILSKGLSKDTERAEYLAIEHVKKKYSEGGYARYPKMYKEVFGKELKEQMEQIKQL